MQYAAANPGEIDILFELIWIFLQPTLVDFSFIARFVEKTVAHVLTVGREREPVLHHHQLHRASNRK